MRAWLAGWLLRMADCLDSPDNRVRREVEARRAVAEAIMVEVDYLWKNKRA